MHSSGRTAQNASEKDSELERERGEVKGLAEAVAAERGRAREHDGGGDDDTGNTINVPRAHQHRQFLCRRRVVAEAARGTGGWLRYRQKCIERFMSNYWRARATAINLFPAVPPVPGITALRRDKGATLPPQTCLLGGKYAGLDRYAGRFTVQHCAHAVCTIGCSHTCAWVLAPLMRSVRLTILRLFIHVSKKKFETVPIFYPAYQA